MGDDRETDATELGEEEFLLLADIRRVLIGIRWAVLGAAGMLLAILATLRGWL